MEPSKFVVGLCQLNVGQDKEQNIAKAVKMLETAAGNADLLVLPEMFITPFGKTMAANAEPVDSYKTDPSAKAMRAVSEVAQKCGKYIIAGTIPELRDGKVYNTLACFDRMGEIVAKYSKCHLFDVDIKNGIKSAESSLIAPGDHFGLLQTDRCKIALGICFDVRFVEFVAAMAQDPEVKVLCFPAAFNSTTGPLHWDIIRKGRAVDFQSYVVLCSPAAVPQAPGLYPVYGHSSVVTLPHQLLCILSACV